MTKQQLKRDTCFDILHCATKLLIFLKINKNEKNAMLLKK